MQCRTDIFYFDFNTFSLVLLNLHIKILASIEGNSQKPKQHCQPMLATQETSLVRHRLRRSYDELGELGVLLSLKVWVFQSFVRCSSYFYFLDRVSGFQTNQRNVPKVWTFPVLSHCITSAIKEWRIKVLANSSTLSDLKFHIIKGWTGVQVSCCDWDGRFVAD